MIMLSEKIKYIASAATVLKLQRVSCYLEGLLEHRSPNFSTSFCFSRSDMGPNNCVSSKFPGNPHGAGLKTTFCKLLI